ncbi:uncharacterized protein V1516DRAFT_665131 [Lipomyces oligophaga]|uniref:uncharacterized protein n=1 Tax=Lipomyces oligophaga TaxID=45792 RepID=UPI0034CF2F3F
MSHLVRPSVSPVVGSTSGSSSSASSKSRSKSPAVFSLTPSGNKQTSSKTPAPQISITTSPAPQSRVPSTHSVDSEDNDNKSILLSRTTSASSDLSVIDRGRQASLHVSFDDPRHHRQKRTESSDKTRSKTQSQQSSHQSLGERLVSRWSGRSPSPAGRSKYEDQTSEDDERDGAEGDSELLTPRAAASSSDSSEKRTNRFFLGDDTLSGQRRSAVSPAPSALSGGHRSRARPTQESTSRERKPKYSFFGKKFDPSEPETDAERHTRHQLRDLLEFVSKQRIGMMTTRNIKGWLVSSSIAVAEVEYGIDFLFHANTRTCKVEDLDEDSHVNLSFQNSETAEWASFAGTAKIISDPDEIKKFLRRNITGWSEQDSSLFETNSEGEKHPKVGIIHFRTRSIAYSISNNFNFIPTNQWNHGVVSGELEYDSQTVKIDEQEVKIYRKRQHYLANKIPQ